MNELVYTVWLSLSCTPGLETFAKLIERFSSPKEIYDADDASIAACITSASRDYNSLTNKDLTKAENIVKFCSKKQIGIITYFDADFPKHFKEIKNPPVLLYYRGELPKFNKDFFISIVGTRKISEYGRKHTFYIANDLARSGAIIVSGMAIGIDGVALAGALAASMPTVAIIGSGIDVCYPDAHKTLARAIVKDGCVITEYPPGTKPERYNFPIRNRLISALSSATLVMEGNEKSGALITARHATEQGKIVYAFPGNVGNTTSEATNLLIKNGAKLFTSADDIVRDFDALTPGKLNPFELAKSVSVNIFDTLNRLKVSCVASSDDIFKPSFKTKNKKLDPDTQRVKYNCTEAPIASKHSEEKIVGMFNKSILSLYKKIPLETDCTVESLIDAEHSMKDVMQGLLRLEIERFIVMLPGDRVKRNLGN